MSSKKSKLRQTIDFWEGNIYIVEELNFKEIKNLKGEYNKIDSYSLCWHIERGIILPNGGNEKLKFDLKPDADYYDCYFSGFLYNDYTFLGRI